MIASCFRCAVWVLLVSQSAAPVLSADLTGPIKTLQSLSKNGADNQAASRAWQSVSQAGFDDLPTLLASLAGANPLGANYLRSAIDVVVDRTLSAKRPVALTALESFLKNTANPPRARRLAFEVITRFDTSAPDRLTPGFINDPSTELRRDAVERLVTAAQQQLASAKSAAEKQLAAQTLQAAFHGARDLDQIEQLTKELKALAVTVDLPVHFGFLVNWKLLGPFDNTAEKAFDIAYPPEKEVRLDTEYSGKANKPLKWVDHTTTDPHGMVDFNKALGKANGVVGYAFTEFTAASAAQVDFRTGCICAFKLWVNGELVDARGVYHSGSRIDQYIAQAKLKPGRNTILVKVLQNEQTESWAQDWQFQLRVCDTAGTAVLSQDRVEATK